MYPYYNNKNHNNMKNSRVNTRGNSQNNTEQYNDRSSDDYMIGRYNGFLFGYGCGYCDCLYNYPYNPGKFLPLPYQLPPVC